MDRRSFFHVLGIGGAVAVAAKAVPVQASEPAALALPSVVVPSLPAVGDDDSLIGQATRALLDAIVAHGVTGRLVGFKEFFPDGAKVGYVARIDDADPYGVTTLRDQVVLTDQFWTKVKTGGTPTGKIVSRYTPWNDRKIAWTETIPRPITAEQVRTQAAVFAAQIRKDGLQFFAPLCCSLHGCAMSIVADPTAGIALRGVMDVVLKNDGPVDTGDWIMRFDVLAGRKAG